MQGYTQLISSEPTRLQARPKTTPQAEDERVPTIYFGFWNRYTSSR